MIEPTPTPGTVPPAPPPDLTPGNGAPSTLSAADEQRIADRAAASTRKTVEREYAAKLAAVQTQARADMLARLGVDDDGELDALADRLKSDRDKAKQPPTVDPAIERRFKAMDLKLAEMAEARDAEKQGRLQAIERSLKGDAMTAVLSAVQANAISPPQVFRILKDEIAVDAETGEIGIVTDDGSDDPPWRDDFMGAEGIARYAADFMKREENANLRRAVNQGGSGSGPNGATLPATPGAAELKAMEDKVALLQKQQATDPNFGPAFVAASRQLKRMRAALSQAPPTR